VNLSVIVPTLNEGERISACLRAVRAEFDGDLQVVDGGSADATVSRARLFGAQIWSTTTGLARQCNFGAEKAAGDLYFFVSADSVPAPGWYEVAQKTFRSSYVVAAGFQLQLDDPHPVFQCIEWCGNLRARYLGVALPAQGLLVRRRSFWAAEGMDVDSLIPYLRLCEGLRDIGEFRLLKHSIRGSGREWKERGVAQTAWRHLRLYREYRRRQAQ
jgi:glycosyltransferase involved in cell wall biosynthesis